MTRSSAAVYRRRRLVVVGVLIVLLAAIGIGIWLFIAQPWAGAEPKADPTPSSTTTTSPTTTPTTGETPTPESTAGETPAIVACKATDLKVTAVADADVYPVGVLPQLSISLTNNGKTDCTLDVGSTMQVFTVSSGDDVWWRSTDCQENPSSMIATLVAGTTVTSKEPVTWDRTRSSVETCADENRPRAPGGGSSYHVAVSIGGFESQGTQQILLE